MGKLYLRLRKFSTITAMISLFMIAVMVFTVPVAEPSFGSSMGVFVSLLAISALVLKYNVSLSALPTDKVRRGIFYTSVGILTLCFVAILFTLPSTHGFIYGIMLVLFPVALVSGFSPFFKSVMGAEESKRGD